MTQHVRDSWSRQWYMQRTGKQDSSCATALCSLSGTRCAWKDCIHFLYEIMYHGRPCRRDIWSAFLIWYQTKRFPIRHSLYFSGGTFRPVCRRTSYRFGICRRKSFSHRSFGIRVLMRWSMSMSIMWGSTETAQMAVWWMQERMCGLSGMRRIR